MTATRTPGITVLADGRRFIDKRYLGVRIGLRVGDITQEQAEERLQTEMAHMQCDATRKAHARPPDLHGLRRALYRTVARQAQHRRYQMARCVAAVVRRRARTAPGS